MSFVFELQLFGFIVMTCAMVGLIVTNSAKQIISHYFIAKLVYAKSLVEMEAPGHLVEMVEEIAKKYNDKMVGM